MESESYVPLALDAAAASEPNLDTYAGDPPARRDGWTPFARRLFLQVLAETGRVTLACEYAGLTRQSAYALRARDSLFAAGWNAACELARAPLADALYEKALDGVTDTITKDGEVVATRHRFDSRLSIAVLHRLDKRCDRAEQRGSDHLALVRSWDEWLGLIGKGDDAAARAVLDSARDCQNRQLAFCSDPIFDDETEAEEDAQSIDIFDRCWTRDDMGEKTWMTDFPPPPGFTLWQKGEPGRLDYERECTPEEAELLDADKAAVAAAALTDDEQLRDAWFDMLKNDLEVPPLPAREG